jgi:hypothetical protein
VRGGRFVSNTPAATPADIKDRTMRIPVRESARKRLAKKRGSLTFDFKCNRLKFTASASRYDDGSLTEIFLTNHKAGSTAGIMASDGAIAARLALQYGCPRQTLRRALCRAHGNASSPLGRALDVLADDDGGASC